MQRKVAEILAELDAVLEHYRPRLAQQEYTRLCQAVAQLRQADPPPSVQDAENAMLQMHGELLRAIEGCTTRPRVVRDMPRLPSEIMAHWIAALHTASAQAQQRGAPAMLQDQLRAQLQAAHTQWLRHELTIDAVDAMLSEARLAPTAMAFVELNDLAGRLRDELGRYGGVAPPGTRQFDNLYGRTFESALVGHLVADPPDAVKNACRTLNETLAQALDEVSRDPRFGLGLRELQDKLREDPRFWTPEFVGTHPELADFLALSLPKMQRNSRDQPLPPDDSYAPAIEQGHRQLITLLAKPVQSGVDCVAAPYLLAKVLPAMSDAEVYLPGKLDADANYTWLKRETGRRQPSTDPSWRKWSPRGRAGGITLAHQPAAIRPSAGHVDTVRPALVNEPDYSPSERPHLEQASTRPVAVALEHGIPYVSGLSGTTNMLIHFAKEVDQRAGRSEREWPRVDLPHAMLATMMFLTYDGGHSLHEALWTLNQTERELQHGVPVGRPATVATEFKADYQAWFDSFGGDTHATLLEASHRAFDDMIAMRERYVSADPFRA